MIQTSATRPRSAFPALEVAGLLMILVATVLFLTQLSGFSRQRERMPQSLEMGGVPVSGMNRAEAKAYLEQAYGQPVTILLQDQEIHLTPDQVGFRVDSEAMLSRAQELRTTEGTFWSGFWDFLWRRPEKAQSVELIADYSPELLQAWVADLAARYERPGDTAGVHLDTLSFSEGGAGHTIDQEAAIEDIDAALRRPTNRTVTLQVYQGDVERPDMDSLGALLVDYLVGEKYRGVASIYVVDLQSGEELALDVDLREEIPVMVDCDIAYAGLSTMKIPILVEYFRYLEWAPYPFELDMVVATMTLSSNLNANFMLRDIGLDNARRGTSVVTSSMRYLGLQDSFIVAPYDDEDPPEYYSTPAREAARAGTCINTNPDPYMQTTAADMTALLDMIYQCAEFGGGGLMAAYPGRITQDECRMMLDVMSMNDEGPLIMAGVPEYVEVAHKHGYTYDTISDAGIVFSPGGDYVAVYFLWADVGWLASTAFPIIEGISTATFNYFNPDLVLEPRRGYGDVLTPVEDSELPATPPDS